MAGARLRADSVAGRLIALTLSVAAAVLIGEVVVRLVAPQPLQHVQLDDQIYFVNRPLARFTYARESEFSVDVTYNAWGFRGPVPAPSPAPGVTRILLIGDSQTEGLQVRYNETYGSVLGRDLERLLPGRRFEIVNLAVSAYGTHQEVLTLRRYAARVQPCWVVLGFYPGNDLGDNMRLPLVAEDAGGVRLAEHRFSFTHRLWLGAKVWLASVSHLYTLSVWQIKALLSGSLLARAGVLEPASPAVEGSRPLRLTEQLLLIARRDTRSLGAQFVVLIIPERSQVLRPDASPPSGEDDIERQFVSWFNREEMLHVEALPALRAARQRGESPFFQRDGHLNPTGHRVVGETLARRLAPLLEKERAEGSRACARGARGES
jgi:lysophospholipase L1-like esterase